MHFSLPVVAAILGTALAANPDKPAASPEVPYWTVNNEIGGILPQPPKHEKGYWKDGGLPEGCRYVITAKGMNPRDFKVFNVKYSDCDQPWVFCRHKDSKLSEDKMIEVFGRMPVKYRSFVRHFVGAPQFDSYAAWTWGTGDVMVENEPTWWTLIHEIAHSLDFNVQDKGVFSDSGTWQNAYAKDTHTVTSYGRSNWREDFAESGVVAFYNHNIDRGIGKIMSNWRQFGNQKATWEDQFGKYITAGGTCGKRIPNTNKVPYVASAKMAALPNGTEDPDTKVTWEGIEEIKVKDELKDVSIPWAEPDRE